MHIQKVPGIHNAYGAGLCNGEIMSLVGGEPSVSVIIPTMASLERGSLLKRAVESIRSSSVQHICIIAVVNGAKFDAGVCEWLKSQLDIQFHYSKTPSAPGAILRGRELVRTEFFSTLDDDDEYLPGTTDQKLAVLRADTQADLVVGNYYQHCKNTDSLRYDQLIDVPANPLDALMRFNWLHNGNALFRAETVGVQYFNDYHAFAEWTLVAYRLAMDHKKVAILDIPVFRCYGETPGSLSKSDAYFAAYIPLFKRMLAFSPPKHVACMIHRKMGAAHHDASVVANQNGFYKDAWKHHLQSLMMDGGLRYLSYTRHLIL